MSTNQPKHLRLNVLMSQEDGCWVARCSELDTLAADPDFEVAWEDIVRVCRAHLAYGMASGRSLAELVKPPPSDILEIIAQATVDGFLRIHMNQQVDHTELQMFRFAEAA